MLSSDSENLKRKEVKEEIFDKVKKDNIEFIRLQFTDIFGFPKNVTIIADELDKALNGDIMFDGSSIDGFSRVEESDMYLVPDLDTFNNVVWKSFKDGVAQIYCDVYDSEKKPFEGCPRNILKKALAEAKVMGYELSVGPEGEFFLFNTDESGNPVFDIHDKAGYFDQSPFDKGDDARRDIILTMKKFGFNIEASHHEVAPGQHEINFKYDEALNAADKWLIFKQIVKTVAKRHNLYASFIPKPFTGENANAMHCNQSLMKDGTNVFYDKEKRDGLSDVAKSYIGGLLNHACGIAAILNPTVNSYKRLVPGYEAPVNVSWACLNRSSYIRIPAGRGQSTRIELRTPDPTANPYLVYAIMLKAGLEGIKNKTVPPSEYKKDLSSSDSFNIEKYPRDLFEALESMREDSLVRETLGEYTFNSFYKGKMLEWREYETQVHRWEIDKYLKEY